MIFQPQARVVHLGSTSQENPLVVEWRKGRGLVRYFLKRADGTGRLALAPILAPLILLTAVGRPLLRGLRARCPHGAVAADPIAALRASSDSGRS